jgi:hypothetical protein
LERSSIASVDQDGPEVVGIHVLARTIRTGVPYSLHGLVRGAEVARVAYRSHLRDYTQAADLDRLKCRLPSMVISCEAAARESSAYRRGKYRRRIIESKVSQYYRNTASQRHSTTAPQRSSAA